MQLQIDAREVDLAAAELRLGGDKGDVVRIERTDGVARRN